MEQATDWAKGKADSAASAMEPKVGRYLSTPYFSLADHPSESEVWQPTRRRRR